MEYNNHYVDEMQRIYKEMVGCDRMPGLVECSHIDRSGWLVDLRKKPLVRMINNWIGTPSYVLLITVLTMLCALFSLELPVYILFLSIGLYISILGDDFLGIMPIVACAYVSPSRANNPGVADTSVFYPENGGIWIYGMLVIYFLSALIRLLKDREIGGSCFWKAERKLQFGLLAVGISYLLAGAGSGYYFARGILNPVFGVLQLAAVFFMYWLFTGAVRWERVSGSYFAWLGFGLGMVVLSEVLYVYLTVDMLKNGVIQIGKISSGWGNANNMGAMLALSIPFAFYLSEHEKHGWIYNICGSLMLLGVVMTSSRTAILGAGFCYGCGFLLSATRAKKVGDKANLIVYGLTILAAIAVVVISWETLMRLFKIMLDKGLDSSRRDITYLAGLEQWLKYPIFGATWYPVDHSPETWNKVAAFTVFFPPRWHNTVVQLAACCGTVGLVAYGYHRFQTIRLLRGKKQRNVTFMALSMLSLLLMSLLDCHFFNIGPTLLYSMALAFVEKCPKADAQ